MKFNIKLMQSNNVNKVALLFFWGLVSVLAILAFARYSGHGYVYILFTIISNLLLYFGFRKNAIFFDTFIGVFFWLGFWLKLTIRVAFFGGLFHEAIGNFDGSGVAFDKTLLVSSCGIFGFLLASFVREKLSYNYPQKIEGVTQQGLFDFYQNHRKTIMTGFVVLFVMIAITNAYLGIYQRGNVTRTILPFGLNGIYTWLLLFGMASFSTLIMRFEFEVNKKTSFLVIFLSLLESFVSNVSMLSRGMILNSSAILYGVFVSLKLNSIKSSMRFFVIVSLIFCMLFVSSVLVVNYMRSNIYLNNQSNIYLDNQKASVEASFEDVHAMTTPLFIDRWVGLEGVMAVSSYQKLGWDLWKSALKETYDEHKFSFYDDNFINSPYVNADKAIHHFISLPGIIAFFFYPGSFLFLFVSMFALGILAAIIEVFVFKLGGENVILCSLLSQVIAFRFASFGYVPKQSYLLFGTIFLNLFIIYFADKLLLRLYRK